jgi:hypothetical protein
MSGRVVVFGGVLVFRAIAAAHVPTNFTDPQVNPGIPHLQAFFTALSAGNYFPDLVEVRAGFSLLQDIF